MNSNPLVPQTKGKRSKVLMVFKDRELEQIDLDYEFIAAFPEYYPGREKINNYTAKGFNTKWVGKVVDAVQKAVEENPDIIGLLIKYDIDMVIMSGALSTIKDLKYKIPTFESVFLCSNKYYQRLHEQLPINFTYVDIHAEDWDKNLPKFPFYFKPTELQLSIHQYVIKDRGTLERLIEPLRISLPIYEMNYKYISERFLDLEKYPLANRSLMLCEEVVEESLQINWEGFADAEGNIFTYGFTDEPLADPGIFSDFIMPSKLSDEILAKVEEICFNFLKGISMKSSFINIELWVRKNGDVRIIEVNPRCAFSYRRQYKDVYGVDLYEDIIRLSMGKTIQPPISPQKNFKCYSTQSVFATRQNGKLCELMDFEKIEEEKKAHPDYFFYFLSDDPNFEITDNHQNGARVLMRIFFTKSTYAEIEEESLRLKKTFLIKDTYYLEKDKLSNFRI